MSRHVARLLLMLRFHERAIAACAAAQRADSYFSAIDATYVRFAFFAMLYHYAITR